MAPPKQMAPDEVLKEYSWDDDTFEAIVQVRHWCFVCEWCPLCSAAVLCAVLLCCAVLTCACHGPVIRHNLNA
jgi:hypothetical protein